MSEERPGPTVTAPKPTRRRATAQGVRFGQRIRLRFGPDAPLTVALFTALCAENDILRLERTARGDLEIMAPAGGAGSSRNANLTYQLIRWGEEEGRGLGIIFDSSGGFVLPNGAIRSPDTAWVALPRWEALTHEEQKGFPPICPDFVLELRSESDRPYRLRKKMVEYLAQGARLGCLIDPLSGKVEIYRPGREVETLNRPATLSGEDVLPGFVLDLKGIITD